MTGSNVGSPIRCRLTAFGLVIDSELALPGADEDPGERLPRLRLRHVAPSPSGSAVGEAVLERRWPDGSLGMRVRRLPGDGYAVDAPQRGAFEISADGGAVEAQSLLGPPPRWLAPLLGQVLPIAATLRGYETVHASAAVLNGGAVAISAVSGTGKSSLMMNLVDRGAGLLSDDVVALRIRDGRLIAHPGSPLAHLASEQLSSLRAGTRARLGPAVEATDKLTFSIGALRARAAPLHAFVELRRSADISRLGITRISEPNPFRLLAATFLPHVSTPSRALRQLEVCEMLARRVPVFSMQAPAAMPARELALALERAVA